MRAITCFALSLLLTVQLAAAEDINDIFKRVNDFVAQKNYSKALNELSWAKKEIEKLHLTQVQSFLPDTLGGFQGGKVEQNSALGITNVERSYSKAGGSTVKVSLTGGSAGGSNEGLGGLMAFGKMAAMMGNMPGQDTFRVSGRTATLSTESGNAELTVFLDSGGILKLEASDSSMAPTLKAMVEEIKVNDLDTYLKG